MKNFKKSRKGFFFISAVVKYFFINYFRNINAPSERSRGALIATLRRVSTYSRVYLNQ